MKHLFTLCLVLLPGMIAVQAQPAASYILRYTYDAQGRLTEARYDETMRIAYTYDANNNILSTVTEAPGNVPVEEETGLPTRFAHLGNYPNPFNPVTTLRFDLPEAARVEVRVFDVLGRTVLLQRAERATAGFGRTVVVDASALASGVYLYRITAHGADQTHTATGRMVLVR